MKIAILSSFFPLRGGIAQFNAALYTELGKEHDVKAFNFSRQYPGILFPGKTQYVSAQDNAVRPQSPSEPTFDRKMIKRTHSARLCVRNCGNPLRTDHKNGDGEVSPSPFGFDS